MRAIPTDSQELKSGLQRCSVVLKFGYPYNMSYHTLRIGGDDKLQSNGSNKTIKRQPRLTAMCWSASV